MKSMNKKNSLNLTKRIGVLTLLFSMTLPVVSLAGSKDIYVDIEASGKEDGSSKNPFDTIEEALKEAKKTKGKLKFMLQTGFTEKT